MLTKFIDNDPTSELLPDAAVWDATLAKTAYDYVRDAIARGVEVGAAEINIQASFNVLNPEVINFLNDYTIRLSGSVNETVITQIRDAIHAGIVEGETYREMRSRVLTAMGCERDAGGKIVAGAKAKYRAEMIARTETARAENTGRDMQLVAAGAKVKRWVAHGGACEYCQSIDGMQIGAKELFFRRGDGLTITTQEGKDTTLKLDYSDTRVPPLHPHCRCIVSYDFEES